MQNFRGWLLESALVKTSLTGTLCQNEKGFVYLKIDDEIVHGLIGSIRMSYPNAEIPPYWGEPDSVGAHISVIGKTEAASLSSIPQLGTTMQFELESLVTCEKPDGWDEMKRVWFFTVKSKDLENFRRYHGLSPLNKGHEYHVTVAVEKQGSDSITESALTGKSVVFAFGRFNPFTRGHQLLVRKVAEIAKSKHASSVIYLSQSSDNKKNPLVWNKKTAYAAKLFPEVTIGTDKSIVTPFGAVGALIDAGYTNIYMVAGSDRVNEFREKIGKYVKSPVTFEVIPVGEARNDDDSGVAGISASKMRSFVVSNNYKDFAKNLPDTTTPSLTKQIWNDLRSVLTSKNEDVKIPHLRSGDETDEEVETPSGAPYNLYLRDYNP